ncbi:uracil-DNA glycosylase family protein [Aliiroseovarius sp. S1339]|uniref:uracil-DNA glycosylase family protein n=1 Tax=Aliiroseovarius sp. S1339 TaxID=2936990 RepID=UPI0020BF3DB1|nr:uracil-DNA glycosylase family protein [Aliiroseovarius sp. S1339]MCK8465211.1 uracil-DNA glycosylase family protein [Aliiroseovarius sp. S1339]
MTNLAREIDACRLCADRFAATETRHAPRPVVWFQPAARVRIIGQAPGMRVHKSGLPFDDPSGDRLRDWMGVDRETFYDKTRIAITPMGFCFPGYDAKGSDLPPPKICAKTWADRVDATLSDVPLTLLVGGYAQARHLGRGKGVTATVQAWRDHAPRLFPLPHPSWRNTGWLKKNPWFEAKLLPVLQARVAEMLSHPSAEAKL